MPPPPDPFHVLRTHAAPLSTVAFGSSNTLVYSGDQDGYVSITDLRTRRSVLYWQAHDGGVLGVGEWDGRLISHGRDNLIHIYERTPLIRHGGVLGSSSTTMASGGGSSNSPGMWKSLTVNSLNFCRFDLLSFSRDPDGQDEAEALLVVPNLLDTELADIYHLPSMRRLHAAVNTPVVGKGKGKAKDSSSGAAGADPVRSGLIMSLHLRILPLTVSGGTPAKTECLGTGAKRLPGRLALVIGYEDGRIDVWGLIADSGGAAGQEAWMGFTDGSEKVGRKGWELVWTGKGHNEAVMAMTVTRDASAAFTVSADHLLVRYDLRQAIDAPSSPDLITRHSTSQIGNASIALSPDEQVVAVGGWDGKVRLFSASSGKTLGTLGYHRETVQCLAFPSAPLIGDGANRDRSAAVEASTIELGDGVSDDSDTDDEGSAEEGGRGGPGSSRWLVSGGKDRRVALWELMDFSRRAD